MMKKYFIIISFVLVFISCQKREWNNPFDPDCPKELFSPSNVQVNLTGNQVNLSWQQANANISGFEIERSVAGGNWTSVASPVKSARYWSDSNLSAGKVHSYRITAKAGNNASNPITAQITPLFSSTLATNPVSKLLSTSAVLGGTITNDGGATVTARGVCWSTSPSPTIYSSKTSDGSGTETYTSTITGLTANTTYYARAYATNSLGTSYGNEISFKTYFGEVTDIDGNVYPTVKIGTQIWMAENLKTTKYNDGTLIPNVTDNIQWAGLTTGAYCWYNNDAATYKATYGALYNWYAVNTNKLAPVGWHVPTDAEWTTLTDYLGGGNVAGGKLKETSTSHWLSPNTGATNESGFNALPGGDRYPTNGGFVFLGQHGSWWTSTLYSANLIYHKGLMYDYNSIYSNNGGQPTAGYSVRCLLGTLNLPTISANSISEITFESALLGGNVTNDGNSTVTERGVVYSTSPNPTTTNTKVVIGSGMGSFSSKVSGLSNNITYYVRAFATNSLGTTYGDQQSFTLYMNVPGPTVNDVDGNVYKTVKIGNQTWMAENLKVTKYRDGTTIPNVTDGTLWSGLTTGAYGWYNNDAVTYKSIYGALYNWYSLSGGSNGGKNICPIGWHIPTTNEIYQLFNFLGGKSVAGVKLREGGITHWISPNSGATNESGFTAIPLMPDKNACIIWTSEGTDNGIGWYLYIDSANSTGVFGNVKWLGYYVRCIKD